MDFRLRRDLRSIEKGMRQYQRQAGQILQWYRFDATTSVPDPVYSTGPGRKWLAPVPVPAYQAWVTQEEQRFGDQGLYVVDRITAVISTRDFEERGLPLIVPDHHLNDRISLDGEVFGVDSFVPHGRLADRYLTIEVTGQALKPEELEELDVVEGGGPFLAT